MLKVFLVEDEIVMREGMKNNIDWTGQGFEFVGDASDGELAYPMIQKSRPDILITDIKMPFMDGLELSRLVKKELPDTKIILVSGYDEFQYAKEAIEIGITDYLVKPVTGAQLMEALKRVERKISEEKQKKEKRLENEFAKSRKLFRRLVSGKHSLSELLGESRELGIELTADCYNILLLQFFPEDDSNEALAAVQKLMERLAEEERSRQRICLFRQDGEEAAILLKGSDENDLAGLTEYITTIIETKLKNEDRITFYGVLGNPVGRLGDLKNCYAQANQEFSNRYFRERNQFVRAKGENAQANEAQELDLKNLNVANLDRRKLEQFLSTGTKSEVPEFLEEYFAAMGEQNVQSFLFRQYVLMDFYVITAGFLEKIGCSGSELAERCGDTREMTAVSGTLAETRNYLIKVLETAIGMREAATENRYRDIIKKAKDYIEENYDKDEISLNTVAAKVGLSPSHFSTIFGQEMGETFVEYLTKVRMEKAKELLRTTSKKTTDIAFLVGYRDAHYFSNLFKKTQGCTPREYRGR